MCIWHGCSVSSHCTEANLAKLFPCLHPDFDNANKSEEEEEEADRIFLITGSDKEDNPAQVFQDPTLLAGCVGQFELKEILVHQRSVDRWWVLFQSMSSIGVNKEERSDIVNKVLAQHSFCQLYCHCKMLIRDE